MSDTQMVKPFVQNYNLILSKSGDVAQPTVPPLSMILVSIVSKKQTR